MSDEQPSVHNRFKLPFFAVSSLAGAALAIGGVIAGRPDFVVSGAVVVVIGLSAIWMIGRTRRNPWWMRSPLDPAPVDGSSATKSGERGRYVFVLAGSVAFVLAGVALVAYGAVTSRGEFVFVGVASALFFGFCAWVAVAVLRGSV